MKIKKLFKKKSFKLSLVFFSLVGMLASGGHSFAKYRDENYGNGNAGAAKFGKVLIEDNNAYVQTPEEFNGLSTNIHAFIIGFSLSFNDFEVAVSYDLQLRISPYGNDVFDYDSSLFPAMYTTFYLDDENYIGQSPNKKLQSFNNGNQVELNFKEETGEDLALNKYYISISQDGVNYKWFSYDYIHSANTKMTGIVDVVSDVVREGNKKVFFKTVVFVKPDVVEVNNQIASVNFEHSKVLYNLDLNQVD